MMIRPRRVAAYLNPRVEPTAQSVLATLAVLWVPSLRSAAAHAQRWASEALADHSERKC